jgi:hypothetical protein
MIQTGGAQLDLHFVLKRVIDLDLANGEACVEFSQERVVGLHAHRQFPSSVSGGRVELYLAAAIRLGGEQVVPGGGFCVVSCVFGSIFSLVAVIARSGAAS